MSRGSRLSVLPIVSALAVATAGVAVLAATPQTGASATAATHASITLPARGAFYYPWYPENWTQSGVYPASHYKPSAGYYQTGDVLSRQVNDMLYGGFRFTVSSWWGQGSTADARFSSLLSAANGTSLRVVPYYEAEGNAISRVPGSPNPSAGQITQDLNYLSAHYTADPNYLWIGGKPALFVFGDAGDGCGAAARWAAANEAAAQHFYLVLKVFAGYSTCGSQPSNWHQYGPAVAEDSQGAHSFTISPGFYKYSESSPRLARDPNRWVRDIHDMNCSAAALRLVTTYNEWLEGTSIESGTTWLSSTGHGAYLDALHNDRDCTTPSPSPTSTATQSPTPSPTPTPASTTATATATPTSTSTSSSGGHKLMLIVLENHSESEALAQMPHLSGWAHTYGLATSYFAVTHPSLPNYLALGGGSTFGVTDDNPPSSHPISGQSVFDQTMAMGRTAKTYAESMPSNCDLSSSGEYAVKHNEWAYFSASAERTHCKADDVPMGTTSSGNLLSDINASRLPATGQMTPNLCNDGHDCQLSTVDNWLAGWIPKLMNGPDYAAGRLTILITFDEDDGSQGNRVALVAIDPRLHGKSVSGTFNHYSVTRWFDSNIGATKLRNAATAADLRAAFGL